MNLRNYSNNNLEDMIKVGVINEVDLKNNLYRVVFEQDEDVKSYWFQPLYANTYRNKAYHQYSVNEQVLCVTPYQGSQDGFILGAVYSEADRPPRTDEGVMYVQLPDGRYFQIDQKKKRVTLDCSGYDVVINAKSLFFQSDDIMTLGKTFQIQAEDYSVNAKRSVNSADVITNVCESMDSIVSGEISQDSKQNVIKYKDYGLVADSYDASSNTYANLTADGAAKVTGSAVTLQSPETTASGNVTIAGNESVGGVMTGLNEIRAVGAVKSMGDIWYGSVADWSQCAIKFSSHVHLYWTDSGGTLLTNSPQEHP